MFLLTYNSNKYPDIKSFWNRTSLPEVEVEESERKKKEEHNKEPRGKKGGFRRRTSFWHHSLNTGSNVGKYIFYATIPLGQKK